MRNRDRAGRKYHETVDRGSHYLQLAESAPGRSAGQTPWIHPFSAFERGLLYPPGVGEHFAQLAHARASLHDHTMPRRPRDATAYFVFHVLNRAIEGLVLFEQRGEFEAFLYLLRDAVTRFRVLLFSYVMMNNHWHLVLSAPEGNLSRFMHWLTGTHVRRWRKARGTIGRGALYKGRFKAVPVQEDEHFLRLCRYVERNPLKPRLVERAEQWHWSSASPAAHARGRPVLAPWPIAKPQDWLELVNVPDPTQAVAEIRTAIHTGRPLGDKEWQTVAMARLNWHVRTRAGGKKPARPRTIL